MPKILSALVFSVFLAFLGMSAASADVGGGDDMSIIRDEEIERDIRAMVTPIWEQAGLSPDTVKIVLVENPELNAFVAGGQNIFLHTGLILATQNPAELFGVVAHETGHIADGHLFRGQIDASNLTLQAMLASVLGVAVAIGAHAPDAGMAIGSAGNSITGREFLRHTRTQEGSADEAGVRFLMNAGLPVTGFLSFMKKLESQELLPESQQSEYVQTHPLTQDRVDFLQRIVDEKAQGKYPPAWDEMHRRIKAKLLGYLYPDRALAINDPSVATQYGHAIAWFRKGQPDKGLAIVAGLLQAEPQNPYFYELRGQILFENGRIEEALPAYKQAVALAPFSGLIRIAYAHSLLESKKDVKTNLAEAVKQLSLALDKEKQTSEAHYLLAIAYGKQGQEGLSRLHLAEEALMQGNAAFARQEAGLARANLKKGTPAYQRADDILNLVSKGGDKQEKRG